MGKPHQGFEAWDVIIPLLVEGGTQKAAADAVNVSEKQVKRWRDDPRFQKMLKAAESLYFQKRGRGLMREKDGEDDLPANSQDLGKALRRINGT